MSNPIQNTSTKHDHKQVDLEEARADLSNNTITTLWYLKLLPRDELEVLILEAAERSSISENGRPRKFSTNDLFLNLTVGNHTLFKALKGSLWEDRFNLISLGIVQHTLQTNGYSSVKRSGGVNVRRWFKEDLFLEGQPRNSEILDADQQQEEALNLEIQTQINNPQSQIIEA